MRQLTFTSTAAVTCNKVAFGLRVPRPLAEYTSGVDSMIPGGEAP